MGRGNEQVNRYHMVRTPKAGFYRLIGIPGIIILAVLFLVPLAVVLSEAFVSDQGTITFSRIIGLATDPYIFKVLAFTLYQAAISTVVSIVIAIPGAYMLSSYNFAGKRLVSAICMIPFVLPSILVVLGFVIFYGNNGMINVFLMKIFRLEEPPLKILYSFKAIILAHAFYNFPLAIGIIASYWERLGTSLGHAAATLGAKRFTIFRTITLARLVPAIISAASLIFLFCFSSFAIMLVLGGGPQFTTMEVEIYRRARVMLDTGGAAALSLISITVAIIVIAIYSWTQRVLARQEEVSISDRSSNRHKRPIRSIWVRLANLGYILLMIVFVLGPLVSIIVRSFQAAETRTGAYTFTVKWYRQLFDSIFSSSSIDTVAVTAIFNSLAIAAIVTVLAVVTSTLTAVSIGNKNRLGQLRSELLAMSPMTVSSVIIGLGYYLIAIRLSNSGMLKMAAIVLAHVVIASPLVLRTVLPQYRGIPNSYRNASMTMGATVGRTFRQIELPLIRSAMATGAAFAFAISLGELNATLVLSDSHIVTLPVVLYRLIGSYNFPAACALGSILIVLCTMVFFLTRIATRSRIRHV